MINQFLFNRLEGNGRKFDGRFVPDGSIQRFEQFERRCKHAVALTIVEHPAEATRLPNRFHRNLHQR